MQTRFSDKSFAATKIHAAKLESALVFIIGSPICFSGFPKLFLRFDTRAHSDHNYAYVTPVEG